MHVILMKTPHTIPDLLVVKNIVNLTRHILFSVLLTLIRTNLFKVNTSEHQGNV